MICAGFPATMAFAGTSAVTTAPAPIMAPGPIVSPQRIVALPPIDAPCRTTVCANAAGRWWLCGNGSFANVAFGPTNTSSSRRTPSHNWTPHFTVTRLPTTTSFAMKTWSQMLQSSPMTAFGRMWTKAPTRVRASTRVDSTIAEGWQENSVSAVVSSGRPSGEFNAREDDIAWPPFGVLESSPQVLAEDADPQRVESAEEHDGQDGRRVSGHVDAACGPRHEHGAAGGNR